MKKLINFNTRIKESTRDKLNNYSEEEGRTIQWIAETALEKFTSKEVEKNEVIINILEQQFTEKIKVSKELYEYGKKHNLNGYEENLISINIFENLLRYLKEFKNLNIEELQHYLIKKG